MSIKNTEVQDSSGLKNMIAGEAYKILPAPHPGGRAKVSLPIYPLVNVFF